MDAGKIEERFLIKFYIPNIVSSQLWKHEKC